MVSITERPSRKGGGGRVSTMRRKLHELQLVNDSTAKYITGETPDDVVSLQEIKDDLKGIKGNPFNMNMESGHANAHIRTDMLYLTAKGIKDPNGAHHKVKAKELGNRVIFINAQLARELIAKAPKKEQEAMQKRFEKIMELPDRATYGN